MFLSHTNARVKESSKNIAEHVEQNGQAGDDEQKSLDDGEVFAQDGLKHQLPHARPGENIFNDHCAADEPRQGKEKKDQHRNGGVAEDMLEEDAPFGDAFGAGGEDIFIAHDFEHFSAHKAGDGADLRKPQSERGQDERLRFVRARDGQPFERETKKRQKNNFSVLRIYSCGAMV